MKDNINSYEKIEKDFEISQIKLYGNVSMEANHFHDSYEIYYLLEGERHYFIKDKIYHIQKGDIIFIDIKEIHKTLDAGAPIHERILISFKKSYLNNILVGENNYQLLTTCFHQNVYVLRLDSEQQGLIKIILFKMLAENKNQASNSSVYLKIMLTELLIISARLFQDTPGHNFQNTNPTFNKMSEIIIYINENYMQNLTLAFISKKFFISTWYLSRTFKKVTGLNLSEYINSIRIKESEKILLNTKLSITIISEKVGYDSVTHFGRVFKTITGVSPLKYRKTLSSP